MTAPLRHWAATHPGTTRLSNQDAYVCRPDIGLFAVADGVGGHEGGGFASAEVARVLNGLPQGMTPPACLGAVRAALQDTHQRLLDRAAGDGTRPVATTIVALLLRGDHVACLWAGDSRAYVLRGGQLSPITSDHSVVQEMLRAGELTEAQAEQHPKSNVITRAIGVSRDGPLLDKMIGYAEPDDRFLLCSDGLTKTLPPAEIIPLLNEGDPAQALIRAALARRARDNVTVLVMGRE